MSREELVRDALELLCAEWRDDLLRASYYTDYQPLQEDDRDRVRWRLEEAAEQYLRGERSSIRDEPVYSAEVIREAARRYAADELASWDAAE